MPIERKQVTVLSDNIACGSYHRKDKVVWVNKRKGTDGWNSIYENNNDGAMVGLIRNDAYEDYTPASDNKIKRLKIKTIRCI